MATTNVRSIAPNSEISTHQSQRFDEESWSTEEVGDDIASQYRLDLGNTGMEGERCVNLNKERRGGCENDLQLNVSLV